MVDYYTCGSGVGSWRIPPVTMPLRTKEGALSEGLSQDDLDALLAGFWEGASEETSGATPPTAPDQPAAMSLREQAAVKLEWGEEKPAAKSDILSQDEIDRMLAELGR
jgi:hypothetical protein